MLARSATVGQACRGLPHLAWRDSQQKPYTYTKLTLGVSASYHMQSLNGARIKTSFYKHLHERQLSFFKS